MRRRHAALGCGALLLASAAVAQPAATHIAPDTDPARSLGTVVTPAGNIQIIDGGTRAGGNLFHSFAQFDLARGDTARFVTTAGDPAAVANVISRVTGGAPSQIDGTIDSTALPNADFWFINPAGIVFGEGARIDVPAAAHFATAEEVRFAAGPAFAVTTPGGSTFAVASPAAFGFLGGQGAITVDHAGTDFLAPAGRLTLAGSDVTIGDSAIAGAVFRLAGVGPGAGELGIGDPLAAAGLTGQVRILGSALSAANPASGGEAGILVAGGEVTIGQGASLRSESAPGAAAAPGRIAIRAGSVTLSEASTISSSTSSDQPSGAIEIHAGRLAITSSGTFENPIGPTGIGSDSDGRGQAGAILLDVGMLIMDGPVDVTSDGFAEGSGGRVAILADSVEMTNGARIASQTFGFGAGGEIAIQAGSLLVGHEALIESDSGTPGGFPDFDGGPGGSISLDLGSLIVRDTGQIRASTFTRGNAGAIDIKAESVRVTGFGVISSDSISGGNAGRIGIAADSLLVDGGQISTLALGGCVDPGCAPGGNAGDISIDADSVVLRAVDGDLGEITSDTSTQGNAGTIAIRAGSLDLETGARIGSSAGFGASGNGGRVAIQADSVQLADDSRIETQAEFGSSGDAGSIEVAARALAMAFSTISSSANGSGAAGRIAIAADTILVDRSSSIRSAAGLDARAAGTIALSGGTLRIDNGSQISSSTFGRGSGGAVDLQLSRLEVAGFSQILSSTFGAGNGGEVRIAADAVDLAMGADIASRAEEGSTGNAGTVRIQAGSLVSHVSDISSETLESGDAGTVIVTADSILLDDDSHVSSSASFGVAGRSGTVSISAGTLDLGRQSSIETISSNAQPAGSIAIAANALRVDGDGAIISSANDFAAGGDAGTIAIDANALTLANGGQLSTSSTAGAAGDIVIAMPDDGLLRLEGAVAPGVITTSSGPGTGGRIIIAAPRAIISNGGSILALGQRGGANVQIQSRFFISSADRPNLVAVNGSFLLEAQAGDVSRGTVERDLSVIDASGVLRGQCAAVRETGRVSELVLRPLGPYVRPPLPCS